MRKNKEHHFMFSLDDTIQSHSIMPRPALVGQSFNSSNKESQVEGKEYKKAKLRKSMNISSIDDS
jgi:hypothetical protein